MPPHQLPNAVTCSAMVWALLRAWSWRSRPQRGRNWPMSARNSQGTHGLPCDCGMSQSVTMGNVCLFFLRLQVLDHVLNRKQGRCVHRHFHLKSTIPGLILHDEITEFTKFWLHIATAGKLNRLWVGSFLICVFQFILLVVCLGSEMGREV